MDKEQSSFEQKLIRIRESKFWDAFRMTKNGRVKSTLLLYSFALSFVFIAVYGAAYWVLLDVLEIGLRNFLGYRLLVFVESFVPALLGSLVCCVFHFIFHDKKMVLFSYGWIILYVVLIGLAAYEVFSPQELAVLWTLMVQFILPSVGLGMIFAVVLYVRHRKNDPFKKYQELPDWKRNQ